MSKKLFHNLCVPLCKGFIDKRMSIKDHGIKITSKRVRETRPKQRSWQVFCNFNINVIYLNYLYV